MQADVDYRGRIKNDTTSVLAYKGRPPKQHAAEMALIDRVFRLVPETHRVLDLPCGGGRVSVHRAKKAIR